MTPADYLRKLDQGARPAPWTCGLHSSAVVVQDRPHEWFIAERPADAALIVAMRSLVGPLAEWADARFAVKEWVGDPTQRQRGYSEVVDRIIKAERALFAAIAKLAEGK